jgi:hypothetical protein
VADQSPSVYDVVLDAFSAVTTSLPLSPSAQPPGLVWPRLALPQGWKLLRRTRTMNKASSFPGAVHTAYTQRGVIGA